MLALYVGGMGARGQNFYTRLAQRYGFEAEAPTIQDHYLAGRKGEAAAAVPDALVDEIALVGDRARIADRLAAWRESGATTLVLQARQPRGAAGARGARRLKEAVRDAVDEALGEALGTVGHAGDPARGRRVEGGLGGRRRPTAASCSSAAPAAA